MLNRLSAYPALDPGRMTAWMIVALFTGAAGVIGVVAGTGNLLLIGLAVGAVLGVLLLNAVSVVVWAILVGTLLVAGPVVMQVPSLNRVQWLFSLLGFFLSAAAVLIGGVDRTPGRRGVPTFVWIGLGFVLFSVATLALSPSDVMDDIGSVKRYFQYWGLIFICAAAPFASRTVRAWLAFLLLLGLLQLPFALYQKIVLVPMRVNMPNGVVPVDIVAGTFEAVLTGAGNNIGMVFFLIAVLATLLAALREGVLRPFSTLVVLAIVAAPIALGETKVALVLLPLALLVVYSDLVRKRPFLFAAGSLVVAAMVGGLFYVYVALQPTDQRTGLTFEQRLQENFEYNFGRAGYSGGASLNRGNVIPFWWQQNGARDLQATLFGHGLGASQGWQGGDSPGHMTRKYPRSAIGLTGVSTLLWDTGIVGTALFLGMIAGAFVTARRLVREAAPGWDRALCRGLAASSLMLLALPFATDGMLLLPATEVLMCLTLGLIAWRARQPAHADART